MKARGLQTHVGLRWRLQWRGLEGEWGKLGEINISVSPHVSLGKGAEGRGQEVLYLAAGTASASRSCVSPAWGRLFFGEVVSFVTSEMGRSC